MKILHKSILMILTLVLLITGTFSSNIFAAYEDEDNVIGGDDFNFDWEWDGTPSNNAWSYKMQAMWKVSVYVAKDSSTHYDTAGANLTKDYYKFGYTFWLYRDGYGPETTESGGVSGYLGKAAVDFYNKEEYLRGGASYTEKTYNSLKNRFFAGSDYNLNRDKLRVPFIPGFGPDGTGLSDVENFFGNRNVPVSNALIQMAAKAGGITDINAWLATKTFTINGETKSGWDSKFTSAIVPTSANPLQHESHVSWVFLYEPVFIVNDTQRSGYLYFETPTGIAKSALEGKRDWRDEHTDDEGYKKLFVGATIPAINSKNKMGLGISYAFFGYPSSVYLTKNWLGFLPEGSRTAVLVNGMSTEYWSLLEQVKGGGIGLRYQRADDYLPTVELTKTVDGSSSGSLSGFEFTFTNKTSGESVTFKTNSSGKITTYLPAGKYTVSETPRKGYETVKDFEITVTNNLSAVQKFTANNKLIPTGSLNISKYAEDEDFNGTYFKIENSEYGDMTISLSGSKGSVTLATTDGKKSVDVNYDIVNKVESGKTYAILSIVGIPAGNWTVAEISPDRYEKTFVGISADAQSEGTNIDVDVKKNTASTVYFSNYIPHFGDLEILKTSTDGIISGVKFTVTNDSGFSQEVTTDESGKAVIAGLVPGIYTVTETVDTDVYYEVPQQIANVIADEKTTVTFDNINRRKVIVRYFDKYTNEVIHEEYSYSDKHNATYDVTEQILSSIDFEGINYIHYAELNAGDAVFGVLDEDKVIDLYYGYNHSITIEYRDEATGEIISETVIYSPENEHLSGYDKTSDVNKVIDDYTKTKVTGDDVTGTLDSDKLIVVWYNKVVIPETGDDSIFILYGTIICFACIATVLVKRKSK